MSNARKLGPVLGFAAAASLLTSCAWLAPSPDSARPTAAESAAKAALEEERQQLHRERQRLEQERRKLDEAARKQAAANQELEERVARLHIALLEREAQVKLLTQKLDTAILEVVRTMAKLRSLESRAEAASNLAETEIALNAVERESSGREKPADSMQAEKLLAVAGHGAEYDIDLWEVATGRPLHTLRGHGEVVTALAFSPDGRRLVSGSRDRTVKLWDVEHGREVLTLYGHYEEVNAAAFSPNGHLLVTGDNRGGIRVWDATPFDQKSALDPE